MAVTGEPVEASVDSTLILAEVAHVITDALHQPYSSNGRLLLRKCCLISATIELSSGYIELYHKTDSVWFL